MIRDIYLSSWFFVVIKLFYSTLPIEASSHVLPCEFSESIDISPGIRHKNRSITFNKIEFLESSYAEFNYTSQNGNESITVKPYIRGCVCNLRPCLRLCCPYGTFVESVNDDNFTCVNHNATESFSNFKINDERLHLDQRFGFVDRFCQHHFIANDFKLTDKGDIQFENEYKTHREYCLMVTNTTEVKAMICYSDDDSNVIPDHIPGENDHFRYTILPITMLSSLPFMFITFLVYICIPELRNLMGKCLLCYLVSLFIYYCALSYVYLKAGIYIPPTKCAIFAYLIYIGYLSASLWLNTICFDLWLSFRSIVRHEIHSDQKQFRKYFCFVWIVSLFVTAIAGIIDKTDLVKYDYKPGFATERCFLKESPSKILYFHLPISIIFTVNIVFFILTAMEIRRVQSEINTYLHSKDLISGKHKINYDDRKYNFTIFLRLFILLGMTWTIDAICFISPDSIFILISDIFNTSHSVFIFILFVMKRGVLKLIKQRWQTLFGINMKRSSTRNSSTKTNEIHMTEVSSNNLEKI